ncbi:STN domain-containing protein, partial [Klebsiella pneumoniae]|uniref:STN domain-containing protein n=1 Tax=Klebsiella pneumoniae TaxID=573 RepID=UPI0034DEC7C6
MTEGLTSPGLSGMYSTQEAVNLLLAGSGLAMVMRSDGTYTLVQRRVTLDNIEVSGVEQRAD